VHTLAEIDPQYPTVSDEERQALFASKEELEAGLPAEPRAAKLAAAASAKE
jgi:hypothetical protein